MNTTSAHPQSLLEAVRFFSDLAVCHEYMVNIKWPDGKVCCPKCGGDKIGDIKSRRVFQCKNKDCRKQFSAKVDTIFEDSPLGLDKWFVAVWCIANAKNGISSCELARAIGVTQKSAWHMLHRIRLAMKTRSFTKIIGEIEADESFIGGKRANKHASKKGTIAESITSKTAVHGMLQRGGELRCAVISNVKRQLLHKRVIDNAEPGAAIYTDAHPSYRELDSKGYMHSVIDHAVAYVDGRVHTNGLENFWSLLKRALGGTYVAVSPVHLQRYLDEQVFRFNKRKGSDAARFLAAILQVVGKRLTYADLTTASAGI